MQLCILMCERGNGSLAAFRQKWKIALLAKYFNLPSHCATSKYTHFSNLFISRGCLHDTLIIEHINRRSEGCFTKH